jgi:hypothetical protein
VRVIAIAEGTLTIERDHGQHHKIGTHTPIGPEPERRGRQKGGDVAIRSISGITR